MYLKNDHFSGYNRSGEQISKRGLFLCLVQKDGSNETKGIVRKVALCQFGHFMIGRVRMFNHSFTVSGSYGSDGLPMTIPAEVYDRIPLSNILPKTLYDEWNKGGGWNGAGSEASNMRQWALSLI